MAEEERRAHGRLACPVREQTLVESLLEHVRIVDMVRNEASRGAQGLEQHLHDTHLRRGKRVCDGLGHAALGDVQLRDRVGDERVWHVHGGVVGSKSIQDGRVALLQTRVGGLVRQELQHTRVALEHVALVSAKDASAQVRVVRLSRAGHKPRDEAAGAMDHVLMVRQDGRVGGRAFEDRNVHTADPFRERRRAEVHMTQGLRWRRGDHMARVPQCLGAQARDTRLGQEQVAQRLA